MLAFFGLFGLLRVVKIDNIRNTILNAVILHSIIVLVFYAFPELQHGLNQLTGFVSKSTFRVNGFTHSYGTTSLIHVAALPLVFDKSVLFRNLKIFIILTSVLVLARVGFYAGIIFLFCRYFYFLNFKNAVILLTVGILSSFLLNWLGSVNPKEFSDDFQRYFLTLSWSFESIFSIYDSGDFTNKSLSTLEYRFLNKSFYEYFFGTGDFGRGDIHLATDVSYLLYFSYVGLLGLVLLIIIHSRLVFNFDTAGLFFTAIIMITAFKEPTFFTRGLWSFYLLLLYERSLFDV